MKREKKLFYRYENKATGKNNFAITEKMLYAAHKNCFPTKEEATAHFEESYKIALDRYEKLKVELEKLKKSIGDFSYKYFVHGDTYGIDEEGLYIEINVSGYTFQFPQD